MTLQADEKGLARDHVSSFVERVQSIRKNLHQVVVGQDKPIDLLLTCALTGSHALLVGVPGLAKTLMVKALASAFTWKFARVQFTPDLMPSDITGYELLGRDEQPVTVGGKTYDLEDPFLVVATQNPIEQEGTYPLPEAQLDRFMMEIHIDYPTAAQEEEIVMRTSGAGVKLPA